MGGGFEQIEILLVEDNPADAELTLRALKSHNFANNVYWVKNGRDALDFIFCQGQYIGRSFVNSPKLVLLDLKLPKVDGIEVLREMKSDERTRTIPVVMLTSSNEERDLVESYRLGVNSYIVKPVEFEKFVNMVADVGLYWMLTNRMPNS
ncbi:MAG: response regulator [Leptospirales bacterium]